MLSSSPPAVIVQSHAHTEKYAREQGTSAVLGKINRFKTKEFDQRTANVPDRRYDEGQHLHRSLTMKIDCQLDYQTILRKPSPAGACGGQVDRRPSSKTSDVSHSPFASS